MLPRSLAPDPEPSKSAASPTANLPALVARTLAGEACLGCAAVDQAFRWMLGEGRLIPELGDFAGALGRQLSLAGFPLQRLFISVRTLHPQIAATAYVWTRGQEQAARVNRAHEIFTSPQFLTSPMRLLYQGEESEIRRRLVGPEAKFDFPVLTDMREQGATDYAVFALRLPGGVMSAVSITTDAPDGFADSQIGAFRSLIPLLALIVESKETARMARSLLEVYLGKDAGDAVLQGQVRRGDARTIAAAIWFCDLRDFTHLSNAMPNDAVIAMLNDFFDTMAKPVIARGGEILKFIGDAMLAIFPMKDDLDRDCQCRVALDAALEALEGLKALNIQRLEKGQVSLRAGIGLHAGSVSYGNIGAIQDDRARLDFTVIGPAVNLAARLEGLCPLLDEPLVTSAGFASTCGSNLAPLGRHQLHGFDEPQEVFGLPR